MFGFHVITQYEQGIVFKVGESCNKRSVNPDSPGSTRSAVASPRSTCRPRWSGSRPRVITRDNVTLTVDAVVYPGRRPLKPL